MPAGRESERKKATKDTYRAMPYPMSGYESPNEKKSVYIYRGAELVRQIPADFGNNVSFRQNSAGRSALARRLADS